MSKRCKDRLKNVHNVIKLFFYRKSKINYVHIQNIKHLQDINGINLRLENTDLSGTKIFN